MEKCSILVLGGGLQGLSVIYSLQRIGCRCVVYSKETVFQHCKFVDCTVNFELSVETFVGYAQRERIDVVIPMSDRLAGWLSENKREIQAQANVMCAIVDYSSFSIAHDKFALMDLCQREGIAVPRTIRITMENMAQAAEYIGFPALIKPDFSVGARGITKVHNTKELYKSTPIILKQFGSCSLQEFIDNPDNYYNVMLYRYKDGTFAQHVIVEILRFYPISGGSSCLCRTIECDELLILCKKTLNMLDWEGFADFDVLYDKREKQYKLIEINPRVPASLRAADVAGVNFPEIIVADILGKKCRSMNYRVGLYLRYFGLDIMWFLKSPRRFVVRPCWFKFFGNNIYYQDFYKANPLLAFYSLMEGIKKMFRRI